VIAPLLDSALGWFALSMKVLNTDTLGTFTGRELKGELDHSKRQEKKCLFSHGTEQLRLALPVKAPFGPHPSLFSVNADDEFLIFIDKEKTSWRFIVRELQHGNEFQCQK